MKTARDVRATPHLEGGRIVLRWTIPPASDFAGGPPLAGVRIVRRERTFPESPSDGTAVYDGAVVTTITDTVPRAARTYYYTVFTLAGTEAFSAPDSRAACLATPTFGHARDFYELLPAVHRRLDVPLGAPDLAALNLTNPAAVDMLNALPPDLRGQGQLRRFLHTAASPLDVMRGLAEALPDLHDADFVRSDFLPLLGTFVGWDLDRTLPVYAQRNEVKAAPRLHRRVGTIPSLRELVTRYTTWHTQVAEFAQFLIRTNHASQLNLFALGDAAGTLRAVDDAAATLGLPAGTEVNGSGTSPATILGTATQPFALRPGVEIAITADDRLPVVTRFEPGDFADIGAATAAEVAAALNRTQSELSARAVTGAVELRSHSIGPESMLKVEQYATTLVGLEGAPRGRPSVLRDSTGRLRLFYETYDPLGIARRQSAAESFAGLPPSATFAAQAPQGRVRYKTFQLGEWSASRPLSALPAAAEGDPVVLELPGGDLFVAWIENPGTATARIAFVTGTTSAPRSARIRGSRSGPFPVAAGSTLVVRGNWSGPEGMSFAAGDFATPGAATTAEVVAAINARLARADAFDVGGLVELRTTGAGEREQVELVLPSSTAAGALGFDATNAMATGSWGDEVAWRPAAAVPTITPGRHSDLTGVVDPATGNVSLFWSRHDGAVWRLVTARWNGTVWSGVTVLTPPGASHREVYAILDGTTPWLSWSRRPVGPGEVWTLRLRRFDFTTGSFAGAEQAITTPPATGPRHDREPAAVRSGAGTFDVFFRSDRAGGNDLWRVSATTAGVVGTPTQVTSGPFADAWPAPVLRSSTGPIWLLYRSDRSVPLSRVATRTLPVADNRVTSPRTVASVPVGPALSVRAPDVGTFRRFVGSTTVPLTDLARIRRRRQLDDPLSYTPMGVEAGAALGEDDLYSRGTVGLYLSRVVAKSPLSDQQVNRLQSVLRKLLPINVRAVVILAPRLDIEFVYGPEIGRDIGESYLDVHPDIECYTGLDDRSVSVAVPAWALFLSVDLAAVPMPSPPLHRSGDPANPNTLRSRTFHDPFQ